MILKKCNSLLVFLCYAFFGIGECATIYRGWGFVAFRVKLQQNREESNAQKNFQRIINTLTVQCLCWGDSSGQRELENLAVKKLFESLEI